MGFRALPKFIAMCINVVLGGVLGLASIVAVADNPIVSHVFTADPAARVFNDRVYVITTHDQDGQESYETLVDYYLFSSSDLVNWQDHGVVFDVRKDSKWASLAFAPDLIERDGKYYLYYPDGADAIGVAVADKPEGPYKDPLGKALVTRKTPGVGNVQWLFDPGVFIDDDGSAYLYFGGGAPGNLRAIELNSDMVSVKGAAVNIDAPHYFEAPYVIKRNGIYYLSYSTNGDNGEITIDYMTSKDPMNGFVHQGTIFKNPSDNFGNNNHQSMIEWQGQWYFFYHNRRISVERGAGVFERSINVDLMFFDGAKIAPVKETRASVNPVTKLDPFSQIQAELIDNEQGIETARARDGGMYVQFDKGGWTQIDHVDFGAGANKLSLSATAKKSTELSFYLDSFDTKPIAVVTVPAKGWVQTWQEVSVPLKGVSGTHKLLIRASGRVNLDWYQFSSSKSL